MRPRYCIRWTTGDEDHDLSNGEVNELAAEQSALWIDNLIVGSGGVKLGTVGRDDEI
jgi:hypothetical protein